MRRNVVAAGLVLLGTFLIGWAALALAQTGGVPEPAGSTTPVAPAPPGDPSVGGPASQLPVAPSSPVMATSPVLATPVAPAPLPLGGVGTAVAPPTTVPDMAAPSSVTPVSAGPEERTPESSVTPDNPLGRQEPAVSLEWIGPATAKVNQPCDYSLVVRNVCNIPVQQVIIRVRIPAGINVSATEPKGLTEGNVLMWELGTLMAKQEKNLQMKMVANAKGNVSPQAWVTFTGSSVTKIRFCEPKLTLKASCLDKVLVGDTANFSLTVTNPGDGSADQVKIHATLSDGLEHAKGKVVDFEIGNLAAGETRSVQLLCTTKVGGSQKCDVVAEADGGLTCKDTVPVNVITPRLDLVLDGPGLKYLERKALYVLRVTNPGDAPATNVTVSDVVPDGFKVLAATDGGRHDFSTRTVSWFLGEIGPGQTREVKFEAQAINAGEHHHKAMVVGARGLHAEAEKITRVEGVSALLLEMVDTEDPIEVGGETAYEVRVTNTGSKSETNIRLVAMVPDKMEMKEVKGPARYHVEGKTIVFEPIEKLAPRADALFRINVKALEQGTVRFRVQMTSTNLTEAVIKEEATRIYDDAPPGGSSHPSPPQPQVLPPQ